MLSSVGSHSHGLTMPCLPDGISLAGEHFPAREGQWNISGVCLL